MRIALQSVFRIHGLPRRTKMFLGLYLALSSGLVALIFAVATWLWIPLRPLVLGYLFPESWIGVAELFLDYLLATQQQQVLINAVVGGSLMTIALLLFPIKELVSSSYERAARLVTQPIEEFPLWKQAWQEIKLFLLYISAQGTIFWIGYYPIRWLQIVSLVASYLLLFATFAIDFIAPIFQRHLGHYSQILKLLAKYPLNTLTFGALFAGPSIIAGHIALEGSAWVRATVIVIAINIVAICWATVAGTWCGAQLFGDYRRTPRSRGPTRVIVSGFCGALFLANLYSFGTILLAFHHKSQLLKCSYSVNIPSFRVDLPNFREWLTGTPSIGFHFDVAISNPTPFDVVLEDSEMQIKHNDTLMGTTRFPSLRVSSQREVRQRIAFSMQPNLAALRKGRALLSTRNWEIVLLIKVAPGFVLPIFLIHN